MFIGNVNDTINVTVTVKNIFGYSTKYGYVNVYICEDIDNNIFVWKTSKHLGVYDEDNFWYNIKRRDQINLVGKLKEHKVYRDQEQNILTRCKYSLITKGLSQEEIDEMEKQKQIESIVPGLDEMIEVTYKEYKEKYSDCETIKNSFHRDFGRAYISIIVRNANIRRLVNEETL